MVGRRAAAARRVMPRRLPPRRPPPRSRCLSCPAGRAGMPTTRPHRSRRSRRRRRRSGALRAMPDTAPSSNDVITIPTTSAGLSLVPNNLTARSFSEAAKRSMNSVPTAVTSDGPGPSKPVTASPTPSATAALTTPAAAATAVGTAVREGSFTPTTLEAVSHTAATTFETISKLTSRDSGRRPRRGRTLGPCRR